MKHKVKNIHFVGIGGSGMSGIAEVLINLDFTVTGSDLAANATTKRLVAFGATVYQGHEADNVKDADVVVVSSAVNEENPEVKAARAKNIPVVPRALMLAELMRFRQGIAVAGTHGKTTTTSLIASILAEAGMDPTFVIGGKLEAANANAKLGTGEYIVAEADESDASFLHLTPVMAVVTNIDQDHMDTYEHSFDKLKSAFVEFLQQLPFWGMAVVCIDDANIREILPRVTKPVMTYGFSEDARVRAINVRADDGKMHFTVLRINGVTTEFNVTLNLPGNHYVLNALAAIAIASELNVPDAAIIKALKEFKGVGRRFERYGEIDAKSGGTFTLIDDYGHHPVEMQAVIAAARAAFPNRRLVMAFQPHRYTRTRDCFEDFVRVLSSADAVLLTEVYSAGEAPIVAADTRSLIRSIRIAGKVEPLFVEKADALPEAILDVAQAHDVVIVMGAGSIGQVAMKTKELAA
ncbi:UDP-N-acetylmuramate--L-alanine ligase [Methylotenera sp.]|uniref:UDP-N-acetylmuramate--L-alanine ligase n=2 Tax=Methylotenera sp. TaxID=2051956 RepID=UPI00272FAE0A|nr:UDP-N-acetylmuramate--L-alanine ligase [Methylotenera sp.]MDP1521808.1 UDP-N-acetylmuramate--L-alanine ligase [Methylotenera sp.]MDP2070732.1 UDP-N-acetylmuramate--L-alanine ligase [Methylotenera sp.]MDP2231406.1 UDP-N-acetylmuramate--L-alanine ligase [Methylotenera sp.]MDP3004787.1 UDP-N-acetylmuramate--L-alanine ligase [Methylotenera sp.]MDP3140783.1 UDP-N-acetylmuramate--L-alanine ligase [Methylotenera sp.]